MSPRALIALALVVSSAAAHAEDWEAAYAFGASLETIGGDGYAGTLLQIEVGRRLTSRIGVAVAAELASATSEDIEGGIVRGLAGVDVRLVGSMRDFSPNVVASIGSGTETIAWDRGTLTRALGYVGFELRTSFQIGSGGFLRHLDSLGFRFGVRGHVTPGPPGTQVAKLCSACEQMEPPDRGIDVGLAIYMGLLFGR